MALALWNGDGFDVEPWGVAPALDEPVFYPVRFDGVHADLLVSGAPVDDEKSIGVARWTPEGPGEIQIIAPVPDFRFSPVRDVAVLDADEDGDEEVLIGLRPVLAGAEARFRLLDRQGDIVVVAADDIWTTGQCGVSSVGLGTGFVDDDADVDAVSMGACDSRAQPGAPGFMSLWGSGDGLFEATKTSTPNDESLRWLGLGDFDASGRSSVFVASRPGPQMGSMWDRHIDVYPSVGDRSFESPARVWQDGDPGGYSEYEPYDREFMVGDVDGDGRDDIVMTMTRVAILDVLAGAAALEMFDPTYVDDDVRPSSAFDFNLDGRIDFVISSRVEGNYVLISGV